MFFHAFARRLLLIPVALVVLGAAVMQLTAQTPSQSPPFDMERIKQATVFVMQSQFVGGKPVLTCISTGTVVSRDGLILTNAHSTLTSQDCPGDVLIIGLTLRLGDPPVGKYQAEILQADAGLDLALLRINREFDGRPISPEDLALPFVELADSESVQLDETLWVVGYAGIGDDPVIDLRASVLGFTAEPSGGEKSWFKIGVAAETGIGEIAGTMSGGGAYNRQGQLIGIPTTAPITRQAIAASCQLVQDTNGDGLVNQNDNCIALGGSINVLRPSNFARPLLRSASLGLAVIKLSEVPLLRQTSDAPAIDNLFFASSVSNNMPTTVIDSLPAGNNSLYLFFDYRAMTPETVYELRVSIQGVPSSVFSLSPVRWSGGESGLWYIGTSGQPLPNGVYEFTVFINGLAAAPPKAITVGGTGQTSPSFRSPVFAVVEGNEVFGNGYVIGTGSQVDAQFIFNNMQPGLRWTQRWFYNGVEVQRADNQWELADSSASREISLASTSGFPPGRYRLALYIEDRLATLSDFTIAGVREGANPRVFSDAGFVVAENSTDALSANPISTFTNAVSRLYARFDWQQLAPGTLWRMRWYVDNALFFDQVLPWSNPENGQDYLVELTGPGGVPDGTYRMDLLIDNLVFASEEIQIGIGQLELDPFTNADGVQLRGQVIDSDTRQGIPNLTVILISEEFSVADYEGREDQVFALATTDRNGQFQVDRPLQFDAPYSFLIAADGYLPIPADGIVVDENTPNPLNMTIYLTKD